MTRKEKKALLDAAELIATGAEYYSCNAIASVCGENKSLAYGHFYQKDSTTSWMDLPDLTVAVPGWSVDKSWRILLILWFREVGLEGIGLSE